MRSNQSKSQSNYTQPSIIKTSDLSDPKIIISSNHLKRKDFDNYMNNVLKRLIQETNKTLSKDDFDNYMQSIVKSLMIASDKKLSKHDFDETIRLTQRILINENNKNLSKDEFRTDMRTILMALLKDSKQNLSKDDFYSYMQTGIKKGNAESFQHKLLDSIDKQTIFLEKVNKKIDKLSLELHTMKEITEKNNKLSSSASSASSSKSIHKNNNNAIHSITCSRGIRCPNETRCKKLKCIPKV